MGYAWLLRRNNSKWMILWSIVAVGLLAAQFGSNQGAAKFFISHFTFDPQTGWYRVAIWDFGSASVLNHPLLGIGLADWERPRWMASDSVDNFWLLTAMRYGIPAVVLLLGSCIYTMFAVTSARSADRTRRDLPCGVLDFPDHILIRGHDHSLFARNLCVVHVHPGKWCMVDGHQRSWIGNDDWMAIGCRTGMPASSPRCGIDR